MNKTVVYRYIRQKCRLFLGVVCFISLISQAVLGQERRILYIGDSITDGNWGGGNGSSAERNHWDQNHIFGSGYMYLCAAYYTGTYPEKGFIFYNRGISGHTLADLEKRWKEDVLDLQPDVLSILVGTNDINSFLDEKGVAFDFATWEKRYRNLLDQVQERYPAIQLVIGSPFVLKAGWVGDAENWPQRKELIRTCAAVCQQIATDYGATFLPYHQLFEELEQTYPVPSGYWLWDGIHPTAAGHQRMAELWIEQAGL
ncbi:MAG: SGNH/GDSL hydrolase family protein [Tannerellaceae bacterium]|nr:SGNH/GDSL hydrolase family protein [Tannerellaceae bacterium]